MIVSWIFLAPIGIFIARYYKSLLSRKKSQFWFFIHRVVLVFATLLSIAAFILVLADQSWTWASYQNGISFAHSITGIITIALAVVQVI
jgi:hypothetical protein